ncbi:MAG TPA: glycosyltransferase family 2 protein [Vicinamibacteria bacterium]
MNPGSSRPSLSVVVPTHDTLELTVRCLHCLAPWLEDGAEVILVDDGSRDGTADVVQARFPAVRVLRSVEARGFTAAANDGLAAARGELLLLLNSDTEVDSETLGRLYAAFDSDPKLGAAGAVLTNPDGSPQWSGGPEPGHLWLFLQASGLGGALHRLPGYRFLRPLDAEARGPVDWVTGAAIAIRREAWAAVGPLDDRYRFYAQDLDFCLSLRDAGWHVALAPGFRVMHVGGATIAKRSGAAQSANPALLWADLLTWGEKRHGARWAHAARRRMRFGSAIRLLARRITRLTLPRGQRPAWDRDTAVFRSAREQLRSLREARV